MKRWLSVLSICLALVAGQAEA
ncbi:MAG: hypothetical protein FD135_4666, partial [Comamonadaceae bacterium]